MGLYSFSVGAMDKTFLVNSPYAIILHVKSMASKDFDHYVLFIDVEDDLFRVFDPAVGLQTLPFSELSAFWDGNGLIISDRPIRASGLIITSMLRKLAVILVLGAVLVGAVLMRRTAGDTRETVASTSRGLLIGSALLLGWAGLIGISFNTFAEQGLLYDPHTRALVKKANAEHFLKEIWFNELANRVKQKTALVVDARLHNDYTAGHIPGAINIPVSSDVSDFLANLSLSTRELPVIVYCQSRSCPYAGKVAVALQEMGVQDIRIYRGGWVDWERRYATQTPETP